MRHCVIMGQSEWDAIKHKSRTRKPDLHGLTAVNAVMGLAAFSVPAVLPDICPLGQKVVTKMEAELFVGNLSKSTKQDELNALFSQAGEVTATELIKDRKSGESKGFAFITMSAQSEADKAVSMFNSYSLRDHLLKVSMAKPREQRGITNPIIEP